MSDQDINTNPSALESDPDPGVEQQRVSRQAHHKLIAPLFVAAVLLVLASVSFFAYQYIQSAPLPLQNTPLRSTPTPVSEVHTALPATNSPRPTPNLSTDLPEIQSIDELNSSALITVPFIRDEALYLFQDGEEKLVARPTQESTPDACYFLQYPQLSTDANYVAYIEQTGSSPGYGGCVEGVLRLLDIETGTIHSTGLYALRGSFFWRENQLHSTTQKSQNTFHTVIYDPATRTAVLDIPNSENTEPITYYYPYNQNKILIQNEDTFYLSDSSLSPNVQVIQDEKIMGFDGWSPNGQYAVFSTEIPAQTQELPSTIWFVVDTLDTSFPMTEVIVKRGAAGGAFSIGTQWYFNSAFVAYCSQSLSNIDGSEPTTLTTDGGGGCHNQDGFVATSPNGQFSLVKYADRFELHNITGQKTVVTETTPIAKGRGAPTNLRWINDDYAYFFESLVDPQAYSDDATAFVHLFDRKKNQITPLIDGAWLVEM